MNSNSNRILFDGHPATIIGWSNEDGTRIADLLLDSGQKTWCFWPSPRLTKLEPELDKPDAPSD